LNSKRVRGMRGIVSFCLACSVLLAMMGVSAVIAGEPLQKCSIAGPPQPCPGRVTTTGGPSCGIDMTCTDGPLQLGYSDGICFRATCPGIWALVHKRVDQASFRRRFITYRHYRFVGYWELKDQGVIESGPISLRELFVVMPDDLIEFKLRDPDCNAAIEVRNLGYIKRGSPKELERWLAYHVYLERPEPVQSAARAQNGGAYSGSCAGGWENSANGMLSRLLSLGRCIGLPNRP